MLYPSYLNLYETGELAERAAAAWEVLRSCTICPQNCRCNRIAGKTGVCHSGPRPLLLHGMFTGARSRQLAAHAEQGLFSLVTARLAAPIARISHSVKAD